MMIRRAAGGDGGSFATEIAGDPSQTQGGDPSTTTPPKPTEPIPGATVPPVAPKPEELPAWSTSASKELRADPRFAAYAGKFKNSLDDALKHAIDLEESTAGMVKIPGENATAEEKAAYNKAIGIPVEAKDYELTAPKESPFTPEQLDEFKTICHSMNLTKGSAQQFLTYLAEQSAKSVSDYKAKQDQYKADTTNALKQEWGKKYDENINVLRRGMRAYGSPELMKDLDETGLGNRLSIIRLFHKLGELTQEDSALTRGPGLTPGGDITPEQIYPSMGKNKKK